MLGYVAQQDQNPVYYEFMLGCNWRESPVTDITQHIIDRSHRRYGLATPLPAVEEAWTLLVASSYAQDLSVQDGTGVPHLGSAESWAFPSQHQQGRGTVPSAVMCKVYTAVSSPVQHARARPGRAASCSAALLLCCCPVVGAVLVCPTLAAASMW